MKRKILTFTLTLLIIITSLAVPVAASDDTSTDSQDPLEKIGTMISTAITTAFDNVSDVLTDLKSKIGTLGGNIADLTTDISNLGTLVTNAKDCVTAVLELPNAMWNALTQPFAQGLAMYEIRDGGYDHVTSALNTEIGKLYQITYPIGVAIMLICWIIGIFKNGISSQFDLSDKHSIVRACLSLIISMVVMSMSSYIMTVLTGISHQLCNLLADTMTIGNITPSKPITTVGPTTGIQILNYVPAFNAVAYGIFSFVIRFILKLNILYIALLQGIAPIFIGFAGGEGTNKLTINFCKAYGKAMLIPPVTIAYTVFATQLMVGTPWDLIGAIVLAISCIGIGKKSMNELFA